MQLAKKGKIQLMRGAARRGPRIFVRQAWLALADSFIRKRHLVFRLDVDGWAREPALGHAQLREVLSASEISQAELDQLNDPSDIHDWGAIEWLELGWRLWLLGENKEILALAWVRDARQSSDFFVPLGDTEELFWHVYVMPRYRGMNLQERIWAAIASRRAADGITGFFTNCRDYNLPSRSNIVRMGFLPVGHCDESRLTRRRTWSEY